ncbi:hypothetical protein M0R45_031876 [Rubus argutus]
MERKPMNSVSVFTHSEIMKMENIFKNTPQQSLTREFFQNLATNFSCQPGRVGKTDITWEQSFISKGVQCCYMVQEVRVRFAGFGREDDEWVNVRRAVRDRSIPLEDSECHKLKVGDLVLCFQDREDQAVYCDAYVVEIQRGLHDQRGCRCIFVVRFDHDNTKEQVPLGRLCCRPSQYTSSAIVKTNEDVKTKQEIHRDKDMKFFFLY